MTDALTARQTQILKAIIDEYIETAEPVGSEALDKKFSLGVSPATIRNEMVTLTKTGYLRQPHTSAGRIPSPKAMKFYIDQLMEEKQMSLTDEVKTKEEVWDVRGDVDDLMQEATHALAARTNALAISTLDEGKMWASGYSNIFLYPEFANIELSAGIFSLLDEVDRLQELFFHYMTGLTPVEVLFGEDIGWQDLRQVGVCATRVKIHGQNGALAIVGPTRLEYQRIIPTLRYFKKLLEEVAV